MANYYLNIIFLNRFIFQLMSLKCLNNFLNTKKSLVLLVNVNHVPNASKSKKKNSKWSINYCIRNQLFCFTKKINILLAGLSHFGLLHSLNQNKKERKKNSFIGCNACSSTCNNKGLFTTPKIASHLLNVKFIK